LRTCLRQAAQGQGEVTPVLRFVQSEPGTATRLDPDRKLISGGKRQIGNFDRLGPVGFLSLPDLSRRKRFGAEDPVELFARDPVGFKIFKARGTGFELGCQESENQKELRDRSRIDITDQGISCDGGRKGGPARSLHLCRPGCAGNEQSADFFASS